jgi:hypothetical protein
MASGESGKLWNTYRTIDTQNTGVVIKSTAGEVGGWYFYNNNASVRYVKLYDKATAPTSADTPKLTIPLPANAGANLVSAAGIDFANGIGIRATTAVADNDTGAPTANDVISNILYK